MATLEQSVKMAVNELLKEKGTISASWIKSNIRKFDFNFEEFCQVYPNVESLTLTENGEVVAVAPAVKEAPKMVKVTGNTYEVKGALKQYGFKWNAEQKAWFGTEDQKEALLKAASNAKKIYGSDMESVLLTLTYEVK